DHTMDCTRSLMVVTRILGDGRGEEVIMRGLRWIIAHKNPQGWGDFPGMETNLERTCDGLDTLLKYKAYRNDNPLEVARVWGYVPCDGSPALDRSLPLGRVAPRRPQARQGQQHRNCPLQSEGDDLCHQQPLSSPQRPADPRLR